MTLREVDFVKRAYNYLRSSEGVDYNNDTNIKESKKYVEYTFGELVAGRIPKDKKEAGFGRAGLS